MSENLLQLNLGSKAYGSKTLFDSATFAINEGEHVGVIGPNGAGKSTLFKILMELEGLDTGEIVKSRRLRLGYLEQEVVWSETETLESYLADCRKPIWDLRAMGKNLGLDEAKFAAPLNSLSGGYRMRAKLLYLLGQEPNLMLLDEPTNYLDLETVLVLEKFLQDFSAAFMLISHDREFLKRTTDHTLEVEGEEINKFAGHVEDYFEQKQIRREELEKRAAGVDAKRKVIIDFAKRFGAKASKARQAQSKLKSLEKLEKIEIKPLPITTQIRIPAPSRIGRRSISVRDGQFGYGEKVILSDVNFDLTRGDHLAVVGFNGVGKSTLLKALSKNLTPQEGKVEYGYDVEVGYYAQHVSEELDLSKTVMQELLDAAHLEVLPQEVQDLAGSLLFSGDSVNKKISVLSGGEKARVSLGKILLKKVPVLLLDEPTNHLDFHAVEALTEALKKFEGTLVLVSHDRSFIQRTATKILEIRDGKTHYYPGTYDDYVWSLERGALKSIQSSEAPAPSGTSSEPKKKGRGGELRDKKKELEKTLRMSKKESEALERKIKKAQEELKDLNDELAKLSEPEQDKIARLTQIQYEIVELEESWMKVLETKETTEAALEELRS